MAAPLVPLLKKNQRYLARFSGQTAAGQRAYTSGACDAPKQLFLNKRYLARFAGLSETGRRVYTTAPCYKLNDKLQQNYRHPARFAGFDASGRRVYTTACCAQTGGIECFTCADLLPDSMCATVTPSACVAQFKVRLTHLPFIGYGEQFEPVSGWLGTHPTPIGTTFGPECRNPDRPFDWNDWQLHNHFQLGLSCFRRDNPPVVAPTFLLWAGLDYCNPLPVAFAEPGWTCSPLHAVFHVPSFLIPYFGATTVVIDETDTSCVNPVCVTIAENQVWLQLTSYNDGTPEKYTFRPPDGEGVVLERQDNIVIRNIGYGKGWYGSVTKNSRLWEFALLDCQLGNLPFSYLGGYRLLVAHPLRQVQFPNSFGTPCAWPHVNLCNNTAYGSIFFAEQVFARLAKMPGDRVHNCVCTGGVAKRLYITYRDPPATYTMDFRDGYYVEQGEPPYPFMWYDLQGNYYYQPPGAPIRLNGECDFDHTWATECNPLGSGGTHFWWGHSGDDFHQTVHEMHTAYNPCTNRPAHTLTVWGRNIFPPSCGASTYFVDTVSCSPFYGVISEIGAVITE